MPHSPDDRPRLIPLEPSPAELQDGERVVVLRDPMGIVEDVAAVSPGAYYVLAHFDGRRTLREVERALALQNQPVPLADVVRLADELAESGFLHGPVFDGKKARALAGFRDAPVRPAICAGGAYPGERDELRKYLDGFLAHPEGPGPLGPPLAQGPGARLLVAPHIDIHRGGLSYAHGYKALHAACDADLFVVFGTAHASPHHLFTLTRKDYDTPLGAVPTDLEVVDAVARELGEEEVFADELVHKGEHSCEFQMVWLRHLWPLRDIKAVPVLCSTISHLGDPSAATRSFLDALGRAVQGRKVCFVAGADLAHVGPRYGDERPPTPEELAAFADADRRTLRFVESADARGFHRDAIVDDERRRLCGVAPIYAAMTLAGVPGRLVHYGQWSDGVDSVSYAACLG